MKSKNIKTPCATFRACLTALGFNYSAISAFFTILDRVESEVMSVVDAVPGGYEEWATITMFLKDKNRVDQFYERKIMRGVASGVLSRIEMDTFLCENESKPDLSEVYLVLNVLSSEVVTDPQLKNKRTKLLNSFLAITGNKIDCMPMLLKYWLGMVEAYKTSLKLAGQSENPMEIWQGRLLLRTLQFSVPKRIKKTRSIKFIGY